MLLLLLMAEDWAPSADARRAVAAAVAGPLQRLGAAIAAEIAAPNPDGHIKGFRWALSPQGWHIHEHTSAKLPVFPHVRRAGCGYTTMHSPAPGNGPAQVTTVVQQPHPKRAAHSQKEPRFQPGRIQPELLCRSHAVINILSLHKQDRFFLIAAGTCTLTACWRRRARLQR